MTVVSSGSTITFAGDGVQNFFDFNFRIYRVEDLCAVLRNSEGTEERLALGTDFKILSGVGSDSGGRVQYPISGTPLPIGQSITLYREIAYTQELELVDNDPFSAQLLNEAFDRGVMRDQQLQEQVDRALKYDISTPDAERLTPQEIVQTISNARDEAVSARSGAIEAEENARGMLGGALAAQSGSETACDRALQAQSAAEEARDSAIEISLGDLSSLRSSSPVLSAPAEAPEGTTVSIVITDHVDDGISSYEINTFGFGVASITGSIISWVLGTSAMDVTKAIEVTRRRRGELYSDPAVHQLLIKHVSVQDGPTIAFADSIDGYPGASVDSEGVHTPAYSVPAENALQVVSAKPEIVVVNGKMIILDGTTESVLKLATLVAAGDVIITDQGECVVAIVEASGDPATSVLDTFAGTIDNGLRLHAPYSPGGNQFTPVKNYTVDAVTLKAGASVSADARCSAAIFSDNNGVPGANLSGYGPVVTPVANQLCEMSVPAVELTAGTKYWAIVQNTGASYTAFWNNPDVTSPPSYRGYGGMNGVWGMKVMSSSTVVYPATLAQPLPGVPTKAIKKPVVALKVGAGAIGEYLGPKVALPLDTSEEVLYSNFDEPDGEARSINTTRRGMAVAFTPTSNSTVQSIAVKVYGGSGTLRGEVYTGDTLPTAKVATGSDTVISAKGETILPITYTLTAGVKYWFAAYWVSGDIVCYTTPTTNTSAGYIPTWTTESGVYWKMQVAIEPPPSSLDQITVITDTSVKDKIFITGGMHNNLLIDDVEKEVSAVNETVTQGSPEILADQGVFIHSTGNAGVDTHDPLVALVDTTEYFGTGVGPSAVDTAYVGSQFSEDTTVHGFYLRQIGNAATSANSMTSVMVQKSSDGIVWADVEQVAITELGLNLGQYALTAPSTGKYWRLLAKSNSLCAACGWTVSYLRWFGLETIYTTTITPVDELPQVPSSVAIPGRCTLTPTSYAYALDGEDLKITGAEIVLEDNPALKWLAMSVDGEGVIFKRGKIYIKEKP